MNVIRNSLFVLVGLLSTACFKFDDPSEVKDRRILAIQVDPPELTGPAPLGSVNVRALVVDPSAPDGSEVYTWSYCTPAATTTSSFGFGGGGGPGGGGSTTSIRCASGTNTIVVDNGTKPLVDLGNPSAIAVPSTVLANLTGTSNVSAVDFKIQLQVASDLFAIKKVELTPQLPSGISANVNPVVDGVSLDGGDWPSSSIAYNQCADDKRKTSDGSAEKVCSHEIKPNFLKTAPQLYVDSNPLTGKLETMQERFQFAWFSDSGSFQQSTTTQPDPRLGLAFDSGITGIWLEPATKPEKDVNVWLVIRDGRGGTAWIARQIQFQ